MGVGRLLNKALGRVLYLGIMGMVGSQSTESVDRILLVERTKLASNDSGLWQGPDKMQLGREVQRISDLSGRLE